MGRHERCAGAAHAEQGDDLSIVNAGRCCGRPRTARRTCARPELRRARLGGVRDGVIAAFERRATARSSTPRGGAVIPGFVDCHTHLPFAGWRANEYEMKVTGVPVRGDLALGRRDRRLGAGARRRRPTTRCWPRPRAIQAEMLRLGTTTLEGKTGYGLSIEGELRSARLGRALGLDRVTGLFAHSVPAGPHAGDVDGRRRRHRRAGGRRRARHLRRVGGVPQRGPRAAGGDRRGARACRCARTSSSSPRHRSVPVALAAGARSVDHLACLHPDDLAPLAAAECAAVLLPGRGVPRRRAHAAGPGAGRRGRDLRARHRLQPGHVAGGVDAGGHRARRAPLRLERARGARRRHAERRLGARAARGARARWRWASAPTWSCSTGRSSTSRTASATTRWPRSSRAGRSCGGARDGAGDGVRALARLPARPARGGRALRRRLLGLARGDVRAGRRRSTPTRCTRWRRAATRRCTRPATARWASSTTSTTRPTARPTTDPNAMARARGGGGALTPGSSSGCCPRPTPGRASGARPEPGQRRFCDPDVETFLARVAALGHGVAAHSRARRAGGLAGGDRRVERRRAGVVRHVHAAEQPRELEECRAEHGCSPIELLDRTGFLGPLCSVVHGIYVSDARHRAARRVRRDRRVLPDHRGQSRRRLPAGAEVPRRRRARWPSAPTRTSCSTRSRRCASWRRSPGGRATPATRCSPTTATCGPRSPAAGARVAGHRPAAADRHRLPITRASAASTRSAAGARHLRHG